MIEQKITIIGGGNLGSAIAFGLIKSKQIQPAAITVTRRRLNLLEKLQEQGVSITSDNIEASKNADIIILAIKPYQVLEIIQEIKPVLKPNQILISLVAGVGLLKLEEAAGSNVQIFRAMPNTAIAIQESMTLISTNVKSEELRNQVLHIFDQLGQAMIITEDLMAAATVLASCGIAFALRYMRAAMQGGIEIGFGAEMAQFITAQTVKGATGLILESGRHPEQEIDKVTTPRGITITGLNEMEHKGFSSSLIQGLIASFNKIEKANQTALKTLLRYKKITVKVGSNVLTKSDGTLNDASILHLVDQIAFLHQKGVEIVLVSSGAVAAGRGEIGNRKKLDTVSARQLWSAVGQVILINKYADAFRKYKMSCAQVLTTKENFSDRVHYLNMKNCISTLIENKVMPIVNENDTISVTELMFTDNDELSGLIASMEDSEALIILSNIDGIYDGSPELPESKVIREITSKSKPLNEAISTSKSSFGRGGMLTKYHIAKKVAKGGINVHIANGMKENTLLRIMNPAEDFVHTTFSSEKKKVVECKKKWISYSESFAKGEVVVNEGASKALLSSQATSLLPIGVVSIEGTFEKGDLVKITDESGKLIGIGKSEYNSEKAEKYKGNKNKKALVHYDYLYLME